MGEVDPAFTQVVEHRPKLAATHAEGIPLIDLAALAGYSPSDSLVTASLATFEGLVAEMGKACKKWERIKQEARDFFRPGLEEKKVRRDERRVVGYYEVEHTKNVRDWKEVFDCTVQETTLVPALPEDGEEAVTEWINQWPEYPPGLRLHAEYAQELEKLAYKLMGLIAQSLGLPANRFDEFYKGQTSIRLDHHPLCPVPHLSLWALLVKPIPAAFIINAGDIIQVWSNETYESVEHRVMVNSEKEKFSIPFFFNPWHCTIVQQLKELTDEYNPPKYRPYNWGKYLVTRKGSHFKKLDVEILRIYHFEI
ncbi:hypothetical protein EUGRSUZ_I01185 [Eucalyptus grandis]|uniref:Uncharacterized protein n=2 Tax=Eucalyptus grandis TaxID=71139 RepID=A0ACC3JF40_EUCGR|nr:hypothetical protein EUGRSUZ_I01185 [Eucalyptus grandis]